MAAKQSAIQVPQLSQTSLQAVASPTRTFVAPPATNALLELANTLGKADQLVGNYDAYKTKDALQREAMELQGLPKDQIQAKLKEENLDYYTRAARNRILGERIGREIRADVAGIESDPDADVNGVIDQKLADWGVQEYAGDPHFTAGFLPVIEGTRNEALENQARARKASDIDHILSDSTAVATDEISRRVKAGDLASIPEYLASMANALGEKHIGISKDDFDQAGRLAIARQFAQTDTANPAAIEAIFQLTNKQSLLTHPKFGDDAQRILNQSKGEMLDRQKFAFADRLANWEALADDGRLTGESLQQFKDESQKIPGLVSSEKYTSILAKQAKKASDAQTLDQARQVFFKDPTAPITGDPDKDEKLRKQVFNESVNKLDELVAQKKMPEGSAFLTKLRLSTDANRPVEQWQNQLGVGVSSARPDLVDPKTPVPDSVKNGVKLYLQLAARAPQLIPSHTQNDDTRQFYASVEAGMKYQALDLDTAVRQAVGERIPDPAADARYQSISQKDLVKDVEGLKVVRDTWAPFDEVDIKNMADFAPAYERTVKRYIRKGLDQTSARTAAKDEIRKNMVIIGDFAFPRGMTPVVPQEVQTGSEAVAKSWITSTKRTDFDAEDLNLAPHPTSPNQWLLIYKGNRMPLATYTTDQVKKIVAGDIIKK